MSGTAFHGVVYGRQSMFSDDPAFVTPAYSEYASLKRRNEALAKPRSIPDWPSWRDKQAGKVTRMQPIRNPMRDTGLGPLSAAGAKRYEATRRVGK